MTDFTIHDIETAPEDSRPLLQAAQQKIGFVPNLMAVLAESPAALEAYQTIQGTFAKASLPAAEQSFVALVVSVANECGYCVPAYSGLSLQAGVAEDIVDAVRDGTPIKDPRYSTLRDFTLAVVEKRGVVDDAEVQTFLDAGFTKAQVLEVIIGAAFKLISNYTNHIADIPLDDAFKPMKWEGVRAG
jgi:uncharacterized peroxidase-related enzyme